MATIISGSTDLDLPAAVAKEEPCQGNALASREWMLSHLHASGVRPSVSADQLTSISAMIAYIAAQSGQSEFRIERNLSDMFNVANAKWLPADQFDKAMRYLVDVLPQ